MNLRTFIRYCLLAVLLVGLVSITINIQAIDKLTPQTYLPCPTRINLLQKLTLDPSLLDQENLTPFQNRNYNFLATSCTLSITQDSWLSEITDILNTKPFVNNFSYLKSINPNANIIIALAPDEKNIAGTNSQINNNLIITINPSHNDFEDEDFLATTFLNELFEAGRPEQIRYSRQFQLSTAATHLAIRDLMLKTNLENITRGISWDKNNQQICNDLAMRYTSIYDQYERKGFYSNLPPISDTKSIRQMIKELNRHLSFLGMSECVRYDITPNDTTPNLNSFFAI